MQLPVAFFFFLMQRQFVLLICKLYSIIKIQQINFIVSLPGYLGWFSLWVINKAAQNPLYMFFGRRMHSCLQNIELAGELMGYMVAMSSAQLILSNIFFKSCADSFFCQQGIKFITAPYSCQHLILFSLAIFSLVMLNTLLNACWILDFLFCEVPIQKICPFYEISFLIFVFF